MPFVLISTVEYLYVCKFFEKRYYLSTLSVDVFELKIQKKIARNKIAVFHGDWFHG